MESMAETLKELAYSLSLLERKLLSHLKDGKTVETLVQDAGMQDVEVRRALLWLNNRELTSTTKTTAEFITLGKNGELSKEHGLPEYMILSAILEGPKTIEEIENDVLTKNEISACIGVLKSKIAIEVSKENNALKLSITPQGKKLLIVPTPEATMFF